MRYSGRMSDKNAQTWIDAARWRDRWSVVENLVGGGQGDAFRARRTADGQDGFLKVLKARTVPERRSRFFREASAYDSFAVDGIPRLIESNAHRHGDLAFAPYIVTEFVSGPTVTTWRASATPSLEDAVAVSRRILRILRDCHSQGCVHRDVKPDNVILQDGNPARAFLLDFGLSYHEAADPDFRTEDGQEVGNRFLRLPELSAGSVLKQDPRSDLSFAGGILFFLIVGSHPDVMQDAQGRLPHQRSPALAALQTAAGPRLARLVAFFDNAFEPVLTTRFSNAGAMLDALDRLMEAPTAIGTPDDDLAVIRAVIDTAAERRRIASIKTFGDAIGHFGPVFQALRDELGDGFSLGQTAQRIDADVGTTTYIWSRTGSNPFLSTTCEATQVGDEVVVRLSGEIVHRTPIASPDFGGQMASSIRTWVLSRIRSALVDPDHLPVEADFFRETAPYGRLAAAADAARSSGRRVLAFVYDPSQPERGQLAHGLRYFLENQRTRDTMNAAFVTALIPLAQIAEVSDVLDGQSMERSWWVVLDADLHSLEQQVIHANGQGGESTMLALARRYPPETQF